MVDTQDDQRGCVNDERCRGYDTLTKRPADTPDPICGDCLHLAERDVRGLLFDYLDLAQLQAPSLSQALNTQPGGSSEAPIPIRVHPEALQSEIVHVLGTWEDELRTRANLSQLPSAPPASWHTTIRYPPPTSRVRAGAAVQRAITIVAPRLRMLSLIPPTSVYPTGCEDQPTDVAGWEAVHHLQALHRSARGMLGRNRRTFWLPGDCPDCEARYTPGVDGPLYRSEPEYAGDDMPVRCDRCQTHRPYGDYEFYLLNLVWPSAADAA